MKLAAYCRVSTEKEEQLASLANQKKFFIEYLTRLQSTKKLSPWSAFLTSKIEDLLFAFLKVSLDISQGTNPSLSP